MVVQVLLDRNTGWSSGRRWRREREVLVDESTQRIAIQRPGEAVEPFFDHGVDEPRNSIDEALGVGEHPSQLHGLEHPPISRQPHDGHRIGAANDPSL